MGVDECKVRVTNVDSQDSQDKSIVIQVIGEMSNKNEPHKKFVQTFVLAKQANGYYVLNDIFRYMAEEDEEEEEPEPTEPESNAAPAAETEIKTLTSSDNLVAQANDAEIVDQKLEKSAGEQPAALAAPPAVPQVAVPESLTTASSQPADSQKAASEIDQVSDAPEIETEKPKDPEPSPAPSSPRQEEATPAPPKEPAGPPKPAAPKTWASMLAGGGSKPAPPVVPAVPSGGAASVPKKAPSSNAPTPPNATNTPPTEEQALPGPGGWQSVSQDHGRKGKVNTAGGPREGSIKAYIKNVTERVDGTALRAVLAKYGKIEYFDISRPKVRLLLHFSLPKLILILFLRAAPSSNSPTKPDSMLRWPLTPIM
jgi:Nuclear transport factor 2 (NTF2) domain